MAIRRILWPTDFSDTSLEALAMAADEARRHEAELLLFHVVADPGTAVFGPRLREEHETSDWALWKVALDRTVERLDALARERMPAAVPRRSLAGFGDPAERIRETVEKESVDLLVLAARRDRSLLREMLLGGIAYQVVRNAPCSILLVK